MFFYFIIGKNPAIELFLLHIILHTLTNAYIRSLPLVFFLGGGAVLIYNFTVKKVQCLTVGKLACLSVLFIHWMKTSECAPLFK